MPGSSLPLPFATNQNGLRTVPFGRIIQPGFPDPFFGDRGRPDIARPPPPRTSARTVRPVSTRGLLHSGRLLSGVDHGIALTKKCGASEENMFISHVKRIPRNVTEKSDSSEKKIRLESDHSLPDFQIMSSVNWPVCRSYIEAFEWAGVER